MAPGTAPKAADYAMVFQGAAATIRLAPDAHSAYLQAIEGNDEISAKRRTQLTRYFREFCEHREFYRRLNSEQFKHEDTLRDGLGGTVAIWAFKPWKWRLYGSILHVAGRSCFVGTRVDESKKKDKANQTILRATAKDIGSLAEYRSSKR